jgi:putative PIN family toxin of toxin-antitoxin system
MKVVFDTNVLVAAFVTEGVCAKLLGRARRKQLDLVISPFILEEFENVLLKKFLASKEEIGTATKLISAVAQIVSPASKVSGVCRDPDDDQILSCALSAKADYLVTGDSDLLELKKFHGIRILTPAAFELLFED